MQRSTPMSGFLVLALALAGRLSILSAGDTAAAGAAPAAGAPAPLVVHEWGTFTNFSGSDGVQLEFRPLAQNDLPGFVVSYLDEWGLSLRKWDLTAFQRMETPVTYFYTPVERDVQVRVRFPEGLLTEFYPPVATMLPARPENAVVNFGRFTPGDVPLQDASLDWGTVHLIPIDRLTTQVADPVLARKMGRYLAQQIVPAAPAHPHYVHARETDSALVNVRGQLGDYFEKFLFYRGVGNFKLPLTLAAHGQDAYRLTNRGSDAIRSLFLVSIKGDQVRFNLYDRIAGSATLTLVAGTDTATVDALAEAMTAALTREGLYRKEAEAMVNSWRDSWFAEEGTRLLYMVPQRITDELLPLEIAPTPDETVRVLVGRMEVMSPEEEGRILELVQRSATARELEQAGVGTGAAAESTASAAGRKGAFRDLLGLGRLAEPALVRTQNVTTDEKLRTEAGQLIGELREHYRQLGQ